MSSTSADISRSLGTLKDFETWMVEAGYAERTIQNYARVVKRWRRSRLSAQEWLNRVHARSREKHGLPTTTVSSHLKALRCWHRFQDLDFTARPPHTVRRSKPQPATVLTEAQEAAVRHALAQPGLREPQAAVTRLLLATGLRVRAATRLRVQDIRTSAGGVYLDVPAEVTKTRTGRQVPLTNEAAAELATYLRRWRATRSPTPWLFPSRHANGRKPISTRAVHAFVAELGEDLGIERLHPHAFRHTLATRLLERGVAVETIRKLIGHVPPGGGPSRPTVTDNYLHPGPDALREALRR